MTSAESIEIQQLDAGDVGLLRQLLGCFAKAFDDEETYFGDQPPEEYLNRLLGSECFVALVALADEEVVGGLVAYELQKFERQRSEFYIYDLAVSEPYRRRGIATALINELKEIARSRGAWEIFVQADLGDEPAIALYTKLGVREDVLHFDIPV
ncbi:MAG: AAC(3)-I family aminoglycoside N-acetyltransferase [Pseudomonadota bacterium]